MQKNKMLKEKQKVYEMFDQKIDDLLSKMTLKEKIGQLNQIPEPQSIEQIVEYKRMIRNGEIGSIILASSATAGNDAQHNVRVALCNELQKVAMEESPNHIPIIYGRDVIHGHHTVYPIPLASAASFNEELVEKCYRDVSEEATADGIHWTFSPMLDMSRDPRWGRVIEGPGEDPLVGAKMGQACIRGFQGEDMSKPNSLVACAKHYIGYGASEGGRDYHRTEISDYSLYNYYLPAFRAAIEAGVGTIMSSFNDVNGQPVTSSSKYLTEILRGKLSFDGFVVSDWAAVQQLIRQGVAESREDCAKYAIQAGVDMDMCDNCYIENLEKLVDRGEVSEELIDFSVRRILRIKFAKGLFHNPYCEERVVEREEHLINARNLASESMVLLKNDNALPLKKESKVALLGPFVKEKRSLLGSWTLDFDIYNVGSLYETMRDRIGEDHIVTNTDEAGLFDNSVQIARNSDVIVLALGESWEVTGEGRSLSEITLSVEQIELIRRVKNIGKKVVGVFFCGRPIAMQGVAEHLDAILYAWHSGTETANAVCDILFGDVVPSGKTTITFPRKTGHIPLYYNVTSSGRYVNGYYGEEGQSCYVDSIASPAYPFGYGLSYTTFQYSVPTVERSSLSLSELKEGKKFKVLISVENTGKYDGKEVVQLYIHDRVASSMRPLRELKAYKKIFIKQRESVHIEFEIGFDELGFYTEKGEYIVEPGVFDVFIGENCLTCNGICIEIL